MEKRSDLQYMYMNGNFYFRFMLPNIPPSYWIQLKDESFLRIMKKEEELEISRLKKQLLADLNAPNPNMYKIVTTYQENYKDIVYYYSPENYKQYKQDLVSSMYFREDCIVVDPIHMM